MNTTAQSTMMEATPPVRELVIPDPSSSMRWHEHGWPHPLARWHYHPEVEIHLIRESSGTVMVGDYVGPFTPGHLCLVGPAVPHNWMSHGDYSQGIPLRDAVLQFDQTSFLASAEFFPELKGLASFIKSATRGIEFLGTTAQEGAAALEAVGRADGMRRLAAVIHLLGILADSPQHDRRYLGRFEGTYRLKSHEVDVFNRVLNHILNNTKKRLRAQDLAQEVGMSRTAFSRLFVRATGAGFVQTVTRMRVTEACRLLQTTALPVAQICHDVRFTNLSNFNRQFKAVTGTTPLRYRNLERPVTWHS